MNNSFFHLVDNLAELLGMAVDREAQFFQFGMNFYTEVIVQFVHTEVCPTL